MIRPKSGIAVYFCILASLFLTHQSQGSEKVSGQESCDENFAELYLSARECTLNNDQPSCAKWSVLSLGSSPALPATIAALTANHFVRKSTLRFLEKQSDLPRFNELIDRLDKISYAMESARRIEDREGAFIKAQRSLRGTVLSRDALELDLIKSYQSRGEDVTTLNELLKADPGAHHQATRDLERIDTDRKKIVESNLQKALEKTKDPVLKEALEARLKIPNSIYTNPYYAALSEFFSHDDFAPFERYIEAGRNGKRNLAPTVLEKWDQLTPRQQILFQFLERYYDNPGFAGTLGGAKGQVVIAEEVRKASAPKASRAGLVAGLGAGIAAGVASQFGPTLIANIWDRNKLGQCQKELGLNESEMKVLSNGSTFSLMEPKASTASIGRIKASCSDLWLQNPADSLVTIKRENGGEIPSGTCQMMKNELVRIMSLYPKESDVQVADCNKLKAPNFEVSGDGPKKTFLYASSPSHLLKVPFDGQSAWPDYTLAVVEVNGLVDRRLTEEFRQRHQRPLASDVSKDNLPRWDLQEMLPCMTTDTKATEECRIQKAAVAARYYYSEYRQSCMRKRNMPTSSPSSSGKGRTDSTR